MAMPHTFLLGQCVVEQSPRSVRDVSLSAVTMLIKLYESSVWPTSSSDSESYLRHHHQTTANCLHHNAEAEIKPTEQQLKSFQLLNKQSETMISFLSKCTLGNPKNVINISQTNHLQKMTRCLQANR